MRALILTLALLPAVALSAPRVFYTDITSGPNSGGENGDGAVVSIFGKGFGSDLGQVQVTVGGGAVARYVYLGPSLGRPDVQQLSVQLGAQATTGSIVVTVNASASNADVGFTVRAGNVFYVAPAGSDGNPGSWAAPWNTLAYAKSRLAAGDILYALDGVSQTVADPLGNGDAGLRITTSRGAAVVGTAAQPIAIVAYPGARVTVGCAGAGCPAQAVRIYLPYWTLAGLRVVGGSATFNSALDINDYLMPPNGARLVNNDVTSGYYGVSANSSFIRVIGNRIHDLPHSAFYYGGGWASQDIEVAWNRIDNLAVGSGNGIYGVKFYYAYNTGSVPAANRRVTDVVVRNNLIHDTSGAGILIGGADWGGHAWLGKVTVTGNVVIATGRSSEGGIRIGNVGLGETEMDVVIANNTCYGNSRSLELSAVKTAIVRNNVFVQTNGAAYFTGSSTVGAFTIDHNLYRGGSSVPTQESAAITGDPLFVDAAGRDFHLQGASPAIDTGVSVGIAALTDHDGVTRPQGAAFDLGAYEYVPACVGTDASTCTASPACRSTAGATCNNGDCFYPAVADGTACPSDGNACTSDLCGAGTCTHVTQLDAPCSDGDSCTAPDRCNAGGVCVAGAYVCGSCTDGDTRACYGGSSGTEGVGACRGGSQSCAGAAWGSCGGQVLPGVEQCANGVDDDCDGLTDQADADCGAPCLDVDGDGHTNSACGGADCNDSDRAIHPDAVEACNQVDDDCNGVIDPACNDNSVTAGCNCHTHGVGGGWLALLLVVIARKGLKRASCAP